MRYLVIILLNLITFIAYGIDKRKARKGQWRIPESTLLWLAVAGGSVGAWCAMKCFHHKTLHRKFAWGVPTILLLQLALAAFIGYCLYGKRLVEFIAPLI